jgi:capsular exopolysaccharide synthesis family protein
MQSLLSHYWVFARRWAWLVVIGMVICGGATFIVSKLTSPVYQASAILVVNVDASSSANATSSIATVPTYAQLITNPSVLNHVLTMHQGLTLQQLNAMITVKPQTNTQLIELDIQNGDPRLAMQLANEISQSFVQYSSSQLPGTVQILPAQLPTEPIKPKPLQDTGIGVLVGFGLAIALIVVFEWISDRLSSTEEVQEILGMEMLTVLPYLSRNQRLQKPMAIPTLAEKYRTLCANLNAAQAVKPFKLVMVTGSAAGEGKSTIAANIASFLALSGKWVLLVDADLRRPTLHQQFQLDNHLGFSNIFMEMWTQPRGELYGQATDIPRLRVLTAGAVAINPPEFLQSQLAGLLFNHFKDSPFDYVIFDTPPLLPVADAQVMASLVQAILLVVDPNKTPRKMLLRTRSALNKVRTMKLGVAINKSHERDYGNYQPYLSQLQQPQITPSMIMPANTSFPSVMPPPPDNTPPSFNTVTPPKPSHSLFRRPFSTAHLVNSYIPEMPVHQQQAEMNNHDSNGYLQNDTWLQQ